MSEISERPSSVLFTLRLWHESLGHGQGEWRGEMKNLVSGETRYFRHWNEIVELLPEMLVDSGGGEGEENRSS